MLAWQSEKRSNDLLKIWNPQTDENAAVAADADVDVYFNPIFDEYKDVGSYLDVPYDGGLGWLRN